MANGRIVSLNVGESQPLAHGRGFVMSSIFKQPVAGLVDLGELGLVSDTQTDLHNHGGAEKAVCVYPTEHLPHWTARLKQEFAVGAFGENFSTEGLLETEVYIDDIYRVGSSLVQVSQPRSPCFKIAAKHKVPLLTMWVQQTGKTGFYFRVLEPGQVQVGDEIVLVKRLPEAISVAAVVHHWYNGG